MREKKLYVVITFQTTYQAMAMEAYGKEHGIKGRLIPVPTAISAGCGLAWRMLKGDFEEFPLEETGLNYEKITELNL